MTEAMARLMKNEINWVIRMILPDLLGSPLFRGTRCLAGMLEWKAETATAEPR
jgi:hypothetical protein